MGASSLDLLRLLREAFALGVRNGRWMPLGSWRSALPELRGGKYQNRWASASEPLLGLFSKPSRYPKKLRLHPPPANPLQVADFRTFGDSGDLAVLWRFRVRGFITNWNRESWANEAQLGGQP